MDRTHPNSALLEKGNVHERGIFPLNLKLFVPSKLILSCHKNECIIYIRYRSCSE